VKTNQDLVDAYTEYSSQDRTREFKKYWEHKQTPSDDIRELIEKDPNRAAVIINKIAKFCEGNECIYDQLVCGLIWDFKHFTDEDYEERL